MKLKHYQELAKSILENEEEIKLSSLFDSIDTAIDGGNPLPKELRDLPWMVEYKSTSVHDAYAAARKTMASSKVKINVMPPFANAMNAQEARDIEDILDYNFWLTNRKSANRPMNSIANHAARYQSLVVEVIDNDYQYKGRNDARSKAVRRSGRFTWKIHDRRTAHPRFSDSILEDILIARIVTVQDLLDQFGEEAVKDIAADAKTDAKSSKKDWRETTGTLFTWYDYENRVEWFSMNGDDIDSSGGVDGYEIINKKHKLGFIPFACCYEDDPIIKAVVDTDQLDNLNILLSMRYALIAATVAQARTWTKTVSGEGVSVDYTNPAAQVQLKTNEEIGQMPPAQTDPNINNIIQDGRSEIASATSVSRILSSLDSMASNTPYSTISALIQSALQSLVDVRNLIERAVEGAICIELYWAKYSKQPIYGQRMKKVGLYDDTKLLGAMLKLDPQEGDDWPDKWIITVQLRPNSPTDRQERLNFAINAREKLLLSRASAFETAGIEDDPEVSLMEYGDEQERIAEIQASAQRILNAPEIEKQQKLMEIQAGIQQQQQQQAAEQAAAQNEQGSMGQTPATGGMPNAMNDPNATRETITGESAQMTNGGG